MADSEQRQELLPPTTVIRWRLQRARPFWSRRALARLSPSSVMDGKAWSAIEEESLRAQSPAASIKLLIKILLIYLGNPLAFVFGSFALVYGAGSLLGHPVWLAILCYAVSVALTLFAGGFALTAGFLSETRRDSRARTVRDTCGFALPGLMSAVSSPTIGLFDPVIANSPSPFWEWMRLYAFTLSDIVTLGATEAFFGQWAGLRPPSTMAAAGTFWIKLLMSVGVIAGVVDIAQKLMVSDTTFSSTTSDMPSHAKRYQVVSTDTHLVTPIAVEQFFAPSPASTSTDESRKAEEWGLTMGGELVTLKPAKTLEQTFNVPVRRVILMLIEGVIRTLVGLFLCGLWWGLIPAAVLRFGLSITWLVAYSIAAPVGLVLGALYIVLQVNFEAATVRGKAVSGSVFSARQVLTNLMLIPLKLAMLGTSRTLAPFYAFLAENMHTQLKPEVGSGPPPATKDRVS